MKNTFFILFAILFISCSPQQRFNNLLAKHPELHKDSLLYVKDTFYLPGQSNKITFSFNDLLGLVSDVNTDSLSDNCTPGITIQAGNAVANINRVNDNLFSLTATQKPDTIIVQDTIKIPIYFTEKVKAPIPSIVVFFEHLGILFLAIIIFITILFVHKLSI